MTSPLPQAIAEMSRQLIRMKQDIAQLQRAMRAGQLGSSTVDNGSILFTDASGNPQIVIGLQPDGSFGHVAVGASLPDQPSDPLVSPGVMGLYVIWDGLMADSSTPPADFQGVQIHVSPQAGFAPDATTLQGTLTAQGLFGVGGLSAGTTYYVLLVGVTLAGVTGDQSSYITGTPSSVPDNIPGGSITGDQVATGTITGDNIAVDTIAAVNLVAGIVVAGIVDATVIQAPTLVGSTILGYAVTPRGPAVYDFEDGTTQGWAGSASGAVSNSTVWSSTGTHSLLLTSDGTGAPQASSPPGTNGIIVAALDPISLRVDLFAPAALPAVYVGILWYDTGGNPLRQTLTTPVAFPAGQQDTLVVSDNAPAAGYAVFVFGDANAADPLGTLLYADNIQASGNLAFSASSFGGTDSLGNVFDQGIEINGVNGLLEGFTVQDPWGQNTLASIDGLGNITGTMISAASDLVLAGQSLSANILPSLPAGVIARTNVDGAALPAPGSPTSSEFFLYELDVPLVAGRSYAIMLEPIQILFSGPGKARTTIFATTDGSQPTNASTVITEMDTTYAGATTNFLVNSPPIYKEIESRAGATWRFLVSISPFNTGSGTPSIQIQELGTDPGDDAASNTNARMTVCDLGQTIPNTGRSILSTSSGSGSGTQNFIKTYTAVTSYSYQGSDGTVPNTRINQGGPVYQGGDLIDTRFGRAKSWIVFPYAQMQMDLAGATINGVRLVLDNNHTWFNTGMTVALGWSTRTTWGATLSDPTGVSIDTFEFHVNEGQLITEFIGVNFGQAFQLHSATSLVLFHASNDLNYSGWFSGPGQLNPPQLIIRYTK